jgi:hypothetical protein
VSLSVKPGIAPTIAISAAPQKVRLALETCIQYDLLALSLGAQVMPRL